VRQTSAVYHLWSRPKVEFDAAAVLGGAVIVLGLIALYVWLGAVAVSAAQTVLASGPGFPAAHLPR